MKQFQFEPLWLTFPGRAILFPAVYAPHTQFDHTNFSITADVARMRDPRDADTESFVAQFMNGRGFITAKSKARPEVECLDVPRLVTELQCLDARNLNRDTIFAKCPIVSIGVSPLYYDVAGRSGYALYLHKVRISLPHEEAK